MAESGNHNERKDKPIKKIARIAFVPVCLLMVFATGCSQQTIHEAAKKCDLAAVERHLQNGVDVNTRDGRGATPLIWAAPSGRLDLVKILVLKGADVNARGKGGVTPLGLAVMSGNLEVVKFLVKNGANVNARDEDSVSADGKHHGGMTPLGLIGGALAEGDVAEFLKQHGAKE